DEATLCAYLGCHHLLTAAVVQGSSVAAPQGLRAAFCRNLAFAAWPRIGLNINLVAARFVRDIGNPMSVRGKLCTTFIKWSSGKSLHFAIAQSQNQNVISGGWIVLGDCQGLSIWRPGRSHLNVWAGDQTFQTATISVLPIDIQRAVPV